MKHYFDPDERPDCNDPQYDEPDVLATESNRNGAGKKTATIKPKKHVMIVNGERVPKRVVRFLAQTAPAELDQLSPFDLQALLACRNCDPPQDPGTDLFDNAPLVPLDEIEEGSGTRSHIQRALPDLADIEGMTNFEEDPVGQFEEAIPHTAGERELGLWPNSIHFTTA